MVVYGVVCKLVLQKITGKETTMKLKIMTIIFALVMASFVLTLSLSKGVASVSASSDRKGDLHVTKECSQNTGQAGSFCTFTSSNLATDQGRLACLL